MSRRKDNRDLLEPASAVADYFDILLQDVGGAAASPRPLEFTDKQVILPGIAADLAHIEPDLDATAEPAMENDPKTAVKRPSMNARDPAEAHDAQAPTAAPESGRQPGATEFPMQCLMVEVAGIKLAVPLIQLGGVLPWDANLTRLPRAEPWFIGLMQYRERNLRVVDTSMILSIQRHDAAPNGQHILVMGDTEWAITCDRPGDVLQLRQEDVHPQTTAGNGLSVGVVRDSLALLLDPQRIIRFLDSRG